MSKPQSILGETLFKWTFNDHQQKLPWPGQHLLDCFAFGILEADAIFNAITNTEVHKRFSVGCSWKPVTIGDCLMQSQLFTSKSDCVRSIKGKAVKINHERVEDFEEFIERGDFLGFWMRKGAAELIQKHFPLDDLPTFKRRLLIVHKGKQVSLMEVMDSQMSVLII